MAGPGRLMSNDSNRRDPDRRIFRDLFEDLHAVGLRLDSIVARLEAISVLSEQVTTNRREIDGLRVNMAAALDRITRLEAALPHAVKKDEDGALRIQPAWLAAILTVIGFVLTGAWQIVNWIINIAKGPQP